MRRTFATGVIFSAVLGLSVSLLAQSQPDQKPLAFEVASVKPNTSGFQSYLSQFRGGRFIARYATAKALISTAYGIYQQPLLNHQVVGGPNWLEMDHFDVEAKALQTPDDPRGIFPTAVLSMLRNLLEDRFHLTTHVETRELPIYSLVLARQDGVLGPGLRRRMFDCTPGATSGPTPSPVPLIGIRQRCGGQAAPGVLTGTGATMADIVSGLTRLVPGVDRMVIDHTGLTGTYDVDLRWTPDSALTGPTNGASVGSSDPPSLFTALQEQLGLRLEATKGPVEVLVIDHVERPTPD